MNGDVTGAAGALTLLGVACATITLGVLHGAPTGLTWARNAVSQYGISRYSAGYRVLTVSMGVAAAALAVGLTAAFGSAVAAVVMLLAVLSAARLAISWFPMDEPGSASTSAGRTHLVLAVITFGSAVLAALRLGAALNRAGSWPDVSAASTALGWCLAAAAAGMIAGRRVEGLRSCFGAIERFFYAGVLGWLALVGTALLVTRHS